MLDFWFGFHIELGDIGQRSLELFGKSTFEFSPFKGEGEVYVTELVENWNFRWVIYWHVVWSLSK